MKKKGKGEKKHVRNSKIGIHPHEGSLVDVRMQPPATPALMFPFIPGQPDQAKVVIPIECEHLIPFIYTTCIKSIIFSWCVVVAIRKQERSDQWCKFELLVQCRRWCADVQHYGLHPAYRRLAVLGGRLRRSLLRSPSSAGVRCL